MKHFPLFHDAYVTAASISDRAAAFAFGDGTIALLSQPYEEPKKHCVSEGVIHTLSRHGKNFLLGDEFGQLKILQEDGSITKIHQFQYESIDHIVFNERLDLSAIVAGKTVALWDGKKLRQFSDHPSTVLGVAFSAKGNRIAAAHYNGITIWSQDSDKPIFKHIWKGSHISITWSPDMKYIITGTQEMDLHVFDLPNNQHLYMSGYSAKVRSLSWNCLGDTLFTAGSPQVLGWNFKEKGPSGKAPSVLGPGMGALVTQVSCHPKETILVAGYDNGLMLLIDTEDGNYVPLFKNDGDVITCCKWDPHLDYLVYGTKLGKYGVFKV